MILSSAVDPVSKTTETGVRDLCRNEIQSRLVFEIQMKIPGILHRCRTVKLNPILCRFDSIKMKIKPPR